MTHRRLPFVLILIFILVAVSTSAARAQLSFTEDFTTTTYKDAVSTTADWNTTDGELKLFPFAPTLTGGYDTAGIAYGLVVVGDLVFVADGSSGLAVMDITDLTAPTLLGSYDTPGNAVGVTVAGDLAFVADNTAGLYLIDTSDPTNPSLLATYGTPCSGVAVAGDHAYITDGGLTVIDITDPTNPTLAGTYTGTGSATAVAVDGDLAFVADGAFGLSVIDITDPTNPVLAGTYDTPGTAHSVAVAGDLAFVADFDAGLQVIDITDPTMPTLVGSYDTPVLAYGVAVAGDLVLVGDGPTGLVTIDISDPTTPTLTGTYDTPGISWGVAVAGDHAFVADYNAGLQVVRIANIVPTPLEVGSVAPPNVNFVDVAVDGNHAIVTANFGQSTLRVIDITDPTVPAEIGSADTPGEANNVAVAGDHAFVAAGTAGLRVFDISDPANPTEIGSVATPGDALDVAVAGDHALVADDTSLRLIDISDPANPGLLGAVTYGGGIIAVAVDGDLAAVAGSFNGLRMIDISNPALPVEIGSLTGGLANVRGVAIAGDHVFATCAAVGYGLHAVDITDPTTPTLVGSFASNSCWDVKVFGDYAFVASFNSGVLICDISAPDSPVEIAQFTGNGTAFDVAVAGDHLFVANGFWGLSVLQCYQRDVDVDGDRGQSLAVDGANDDILHARLTTVQSNDVSWELSGDGGANWQSVVVDNAWNAIVFPGTDLLWRSTHSLATPGANPVASQLTLEWLVEAPVIDAISDIANDQGRQVRVEWTRSGHDFVGDSQQIVEYAIYRQIDPALATATLQSTARKFDGLSAAARAHAAMMQAAGWDFLLTVPVRVEDHYALVAPTLADSTIVGGLYATTFRVSALTATPGVFFDSPPDSGYSVDNLAPGVPQSFAIAYNTGGGNTLSWDVAEDPDFQFYRVYRSTDPNFIPSPATLVDETAVNGWSDPDFDGWNVHYRVTALDYSGNESDPAAAGTVTGIEETPVDPKRLALYGNVPNPFNPQTVIRYDVPPGGASLKLVVYDTAGRRVRTLVEGFVAAGQRHVTWDGRNDSGQSVATGVYFYRMTSGGFVRTRKMVLLK